ncbi:MAG: SDR family NAD(P)-dependent oxidoreductase [Verrucomicrobiota bacterium]|nr:SDR family NAD(P)-dependent oxidoreductase [Verrucomicrobiota bacterium]
MFSLNGKSAIVTGGGSGIGLAISKAFAKQGAHVSILEVDAQAGEKATKEINKENGTAESYTCDVSQQAEVKNIFEKIAGKHSINCLINNAGIAHVGNVLNTTEEDFDRVLKVNVKGVYNCLQAGVSHMKQRGGSIVNIASTVSVMAIDDRFAYSTSKGAVLSMTYAVARDFLKDKIRCNAILPARIHTPFVDGFIQKNYPDNVEEMFKKLSDAQPIGRMGKPEEVAAMAVFLCSDEASFITGCPYPVDGGTLNIR